MGTSRISFSSPRRGPICFPIGMPTSKKELIRGTRETINEEKEEQEKTEKTEKDQIPISVFSVLFVASCSILGETIMPKSALDHSCRDIGLGFAGFLAMALTLC